MHLRLSAISKRFGAVQAVADADLDIRSGQVLALLGENGAGKSTLMKLLYGVHRPDAGSIIIDRMPVALDSPRAAMAAGIGMVFQQSNLVPALTVRENLALALDVDRWWIGRRARTLRHLDDQLHAFAPGVAAGRRLPASVSVSCNSSSSSSCECETPAASSSTSPVRPSRPLRHSDCGRWSANWRPPGSRWC